jgi:phosphatidylinositol kinase/protein kinase (PI-3  family)
MQTDFYPSYSATHMIDHQESVPFRLTPNFTEFCTPFLIEGTSIGC